MVDHKRLGECLLKCSGWVGRSGLLPISNRSTNREGSMWGVCTSLPHPPLFRSHTVTSLYTSLVCVSNTSYHIKLAPQPWSWPAPQPWSWPMALQVGLVPTLEHVDDGHIQITTFIIFYNLDSASLASKRRQCKTTNKNI